MDLYSPSGPQRPRPAVVLIHGGPIPRTGAKNMAVFVSYGELLAASGFVAVAFNHRFVAPGRLTDAGGDVTDLVAHVRKNAGSLGVDPERLALWAFSGGGPFLAAPLREQPTWLASRGGLLRGSGPAAAPTWRRQRDQRRRAPDVLCDPQSGRRTKRAAHPRRTGRLGSTGQSIASSRRPWTTAGFSIC